MGNQQKGGKSEDLVKKASMVAGDRRKNFGFKKK
jgi:hypothetical protein